MTTFHANVISADQADAADSAPRLVDLARTMENNVTPSTASFLSPTIQEQRVRVRTVANRCE